MAVYPPVSSNQKLGERKHSMCLPSRSSPNLFFANSSHMYLFWGPPTLILVSREAQEMAHAPHIHIFTGSREGARGQKVNFWTRGRWISSHCPPAAWITWSRQTWTLLQVNNYSCICHKYLAEGAIAKIEIVSPSNCQMARINSEDLKYWCTFSIIDISRSRLSDCILTEHLGWLRN